MSVDLNTSSTATHTIATAKRLVIKIGSALLIDSKTGAVRRDWLNSVADDIMACREREQDVIVVSSGAIAIGRERLGLKGRALRLEEKQAAAATGQVQLAHAFEEAMGRHGVRVAQILLTLDDTEERRRHLNARSTINQLLALNAVPIINENDTVATQEIRFGDNDRLAARVAVMISADTLLLLSDIDGLYDSDPRDTPDATHIAEIHNLDSRIEAMAGAAPAGYSSGGMVTKLQGAKIALAGGCRMAIANGASDHPLQRLVEGERCTWFLPNSEPRTARKQWIGGALNTVGALIVDPGAEAALRKGRSLLPAGVTSVTGEFERGDTVSIKVLDESGASRLLGRGLSAYSSQDAVRIAGHKTGEIHQLLGYRGRDEMIHRDDLVLD
ncbi:MAG: glutamate 5-kinase [Alphaproteobacteria bacterium]|jgi:glutamate 5-kinase